jgi:precorrin-4 methylase
MVFFMYFGLMNTILDCAIRIILVKRKKMLILRANTIIKSLYATSIINPDVLKMVSDADGILQRIRLNLRMILPIILDT